MDLAQLTRILQLSITPVALISGVGLLLLSMTNRLGRVIDRARAVQELGERADPREIGILLRRARLLQIAIALISVSTFLSILMVATLFFMYLSSVNLAWMILTLFGACLVGLAGSIAAFLGDIFLSTRWLGISLRAPR